MRKRQNRWSKWSALGWAVLLLGWSGPGDAGAGDRATQRLFYLFSAAEPVHQERAAELGRLVRVYGGRLEVIGLARRGPGDVQPGFAVRDARLGAAWRDVPPALKERLGLEDDYLLLAGDDGAVFDGGDARVVASLAAERAAASGASVPTEVDESTWGKVKDLFK